MIPVEILVAIVALGVGIVSGVLGIGGAIVFVPGLLYLPGLLGGERLSVHLVTGLSVVQVVVAGIAAGVSHARAGHVDRRLVVLVGGPMSVGSLAGGAFSTLASTDLLLLIFAAIASSSAMLVILRREEAIGATHAESPGSVRPALLGAVIGVATGFVGAGGGIMLVPSLMRFLHLSLRSAIGSSLLITLAGGIAALFGKLLSGQVPLSLTPWVLVGAIPGAVVGSLLSRRLRTTGLRTLLGLVAAGVATVAWADLFLD